MAHGVAETLTRLAETAVPAHHRITKSWFGRSVRFDNPWSTWRDAGLGTVLRWQHERFQKDINTGGYLMSCAKPTAADFAAAFPAEAVDYAALAAPPADAVQAMWVGHATVLVQLGGATFLTDPVFSKRCSPFQFLGPKRVTPPALDATTPQLPSLDFVCISHNHYDHLDRGSVMQLNERFGRGLTWYIPLGLGSWFREHKIANYVELDWWEEATHVSANGGSPIRLTFTPAQHWSSRSPWSTKESLWGGWAVSSDEHRFWFAGDTGYCPVFKEIGERLGPFDLSAIPTGAYEPRWMMRPQHVDPEEAVQIHCDVRSAHSMAIHLATFCLTDEAMDEPIVRLAEAAKLAGLTHDSFVTVRHGSVFSTARGEYQRRPKTLDARRVLG